MSQPTDSVINELQGIGFTYFATATCDCRYYFQKRFASGHMCRINRYKKLHKDNAGHSEIFIVDELGKEVLYRDFMSVNIEKLNNWFDLVNATDDI